MRDNDGNLHYMLTDHLGSVVAIIDFTGTLTSQQRYLPFGQARTDVSSPNVPSTDLSYTGQRSLDAGMGGLMDYRARFYSHLLIRFIQPDTIVPGPANPQAFNRYSYVMNRPVNFNDPTGHCPEENSGCRDVQFKQFIKPQLGKGGRGGGDREGGNDREPSSISYTQENGFCVNAGGYINCSGGDNYWEGWRKEVWLPVLLEKLSAFSDTGDLANFGIDGYEYWSGRKVSPKIGLGIDIIKQLLEDASRNDLTWDQGVAQKSG